MSFQRKEPYLRVNTNVNAEQSIAWFGREDEIDAEDENNNLNHWYCVQAPSPAVNCRPLSKRFALSETDSSSIK